MGVIALGGFVKTPSRFLRLRAEQCQEQHRRFFGQQHQLLEQGERDRICPVQIFKDKHEWVILSGVLKEMKDRVEGFLPQLWGFEIAHAFGIFTVELQSQQCGNERGDFECPMMFRDSLDPDLDAFVFFRIRLFRQQPEVPIEEVAGAVNNLIKEGKVKHFYRCLVWWELLRASVTASHV